MASAFAVQEHTETKFWHLQGSCQDGDVLATARRLQEALSLDSWGAWVEPAVAPNPDGSPSRHDGFSPWMRRWPQAGQALPRILELRAGGWTVGRKGAGGLHLVAGANGLPGLRWFAFCETEFQGAVAATAFKRSYPVLARRDTKRFFGDRAPNWLKKNGGLTLMEYWLDERLFAWAVLPETDAGRK